MLTSIAVKTLRIWLLVLLAIALPLRGAMAAAMSCADGPGHVHAAPVADNAPDHAGHGGQDASHSHAQHDHASASSHDAGDKCSLCAACCSVAVPATVRVAMPQAPPVAVQFPEHRAPHAEFFSGGQERPPRTI